MIRGLSHLTLAVRDVERGVTFYRDVLGFDVAKTWSGGAYLTAGPLWLCLSLDPESRPEPIQDYSHVAFDVAAEDFETAAERVRGSGAPMEGQSKRGRLALFPGPGRPQARTACRVAAQPACRYGSHAIRLTLDSCAPMMAAAIFHNPNRWGTILRCVFAR